jgi:hypothetical protein
MSDKLEILLIGCIVIIGIVMSAYGLYLTISSSDIIARNIAFLPIGLGFTMSIIWSFELIRKYKELK